MREMKNRWISAMLIACLLLPAQIFAQSTPISNTDNPFLNDETYLDPSLDATNDIAYTYAEPQYDEFQDPKKKYFYETFFAPIEEEGDEEKHVEWAKHEFEMERRENPEFPIEIYVVGPEGTELKNDPQIQGMVEKLTVKDMQVTYENVPAYEEYSLEQEIKSGSYTTPQKSK